MGNSATTAAYPVIDSGAHCGPDEGCITCGDVAVPLEVLRVDEARGLALCRDAEGRRESVEVALVAPVAVGETLLVHAGTALAKLDDEPAAGEAEERPVADPGTPGREAKEVPGI